MPDKFTFRMKAIHIFTLGIPAVDHSRVILHDADPNDPGSDYINANYIVVHMSIIQCIFSTE